MKYENPFRPLIEQVSDQPDPTSGDAADLDAVNAIDVQVDAYAVRQGDHIAPIDGTVRVVVASVERDGWAWITTHGEPAQRHHPREPVTLRCPPKRTSGYAYYAEVVAGHAFVYRHVGGGTFEPVVFADVITA